jgi:DNA repair ATPase RecN
LSTLTKILIVLLTISSIFLCGIVVTYVGTATNYKKEFESRRDSINSLKKENASLKDQINALNDTISKDAIAHSSRIDAYKQEIDQLNTDLGEYKMKLDDAQTRIDNNSSILADNLKTIATNNQLVKEAQTKVAELEALKTNNKKQIDDLTSTIVSKDAELDQIEIEKKQLIEEKTQLQNRLDQYLQQVGKASVTPAPVTAMTGPAQIAPPVRNLDLEGVISEVKSQDSLVSISKGSADGVKQGMRFHVVRNDKFICDIVIFNVDADQASGYFDLVGEDLPRAGDIVKTNL